MRSHLLNVYNQLPISFEKGDGVWLYDNLGNKYLDAYSGLAVTILGHNHPKITKVIQEQAAKIIHASNIVQSPQPIELSNILADIFGANSRVFFNNSGSEAVETAIKLARLYGHSKNISTPKIIVMERSFHGRTLATIFAGGNARAQDGFGPEVPGFIRVKYNDVAAIETAIANDSNVVAVLLEPIQGESGVNVPDDDYLVKIRELCDNYQLLMILDEIQSGMARTGKFFAYQHANITPDVVCMAKGLANGIPIGACIIKEPYYELFKQGSHGSTFGGNPLSCATAIAVVQEITTQNLIENAKVQGQLLIEGLKKALAKHKNVLEVRGKGLMIGIMLERDCREILPLALKNNIIFSVANQNTIRLLPPLIITKPEVEQIIATITKLITEFVYSKVVYS